MQMSIPKTGNTGPMDICMVRYGATIIKNEAVVKAENAGQTQDAYLAVVQAENTNTPAVEATMPAAEAADGVPAKVWVKEYIAGNKAAYNKFYYKLSKLQDSTLRAEWKQIRDTGTKEEAQEFMEYIMHGAQELGPKTVVSSGEILDKESTWMP